MRCDWPTGFNEDCADPACEIYLQLFIENPDIADDILLPDDDSTGYNQLVPAFIAVDPEQGEDFFMNFQADEVSDIHSLNGDLCMNIVSVTSDNSSESSDSYSDTHGHFSGVVPQHEEIADSEYAVSVLSNSVSEVSVCEAENQDELSGAELHCKETSSKLSDEETSRDTWLPNENFVDGEDFHEDESDVYSELEFLSSDSPSSECFDEASSNDTEEDTDICDTVPLSSELLNVTESSQEIESSSDNIRTSTHVSLLVVVPPTNFSNEISDSLLSTHSPDHLFAELLPLDAPCSTELLEPCKENVQDRNSQEICMCKEMATFGKSNNTTSVADCQNPDTVLLPNLTGINSDCEVSSLLSECSVLYEMGFDDLGCKSNGSENTVLSVENEDCYEFSTDESVLSKKRKVSSSGEDVINKVPRYSSDASTDSVNVQEKVENYCKVLSCDSDKQISSDGSVSDILPTTASEDNVILTLGKAVEDSAVVNEKPKCR